MVTIEDPFDTIKWLEAFATKRYWARTTIILVKHAQRIVSLLFLVFIAICLEWKGKCLE